MMGLLIAWAYLNAVRERESGLGFGRHSILIAPGLFVRDRLLIDFAPPNKKPSVFFADPVIPPEFESVWNLKVYSPETCPRTLDPAEGALVVTNYHQLLRRREDMVEARTLSPQERQLGLLFESGEPDRLEAVDTPLIERFSRSRGLLVLNDEAHHVWDETGHAKFEQRAKDKAKLTRQASGAHRRPPPCTAHVRQPLPPSEARSLLAWPRPRSLTHACDRAVRPLGTGAPGRRSERRLIRSSGGIGSQNPPWTHPSGRSEVS